MQSKVTDISVRSQFGRHVPRILRRQLILQLMQQYLNCEKPIDGSMKIEPGSLILNECRPSIQRFYGALLFVDISGFTALAQQLSVEDLKFHINEYFSKMLDIVDKHGGDVIKFAGDALFIIWEVNQMMKLPDDRDETVEEKMNFYQASKQAVTIAVECGLEINDQCSNHKVPLVDRNADKTPSTTPVARATFLSTLMGTGRGSVSVAPSTPVPPQESFAYLNVHAGVTIGLMAGIDIGYNDRWEYFLMGEPLSKVAIAEAQALTGEIVVCPEAHALLHPSIKPMIQRAMTKLKVCKAMVKKMKDDEKSISTLDFNELQRLKKSKEQFDESAVQLFCGCAKGLHGYCKVKRQTDVPASRSRRGRLRNKIDEMFVFEETNNEIESVFDTFVGPRLEGMSTVDDFQNEFLRDLSNAVALNTVPVVPSSVTGIAKAALNVKTVGDRVKVEFVKWAHSCLIDDIARHVHDVVRSTYRFEDTSRIDVCRREIIKQLTTLNASETVLRAKEKFHEAMMRSRLRKMEQSAKILEGTGQMLQRSLSAHRLSIAPQRKMSFAKLLDQDQAGFSAEIRNVTVMFVKIDMPHMDLLVESQSNPGENFGQFGFLTKTVNESLADVLLLHRLQSCMEALTESFATHGGQLRQFIVDDKGTVCIGTFGLKGAVNDDNAAAALETAHIIVMKLQGIGLNCSIGVTLGRAFCGLVGSENRHEYAVMGPSTNLSARLMCKAALGGIICDVEIRNHDRTHQFNTLADIIAKGYKEPVGTFEPIFKDENEVVNRSKLMSMGSYNFSHSVRFGINNSDDNSPEAKSVRMGSSNRMVSKRGMSMASMKDSEGSEYGDFDESLEALEGDICHVILKMCKGPFYGTPSDTGDNKGETRTELIGRDVEVKRILVFLFNRLVAEDSHLPRFRIDQPTRFCGIVGPQGIGKSSVLYAVSHQLTTAVLASRSLKVHTFKSRINGFQSTVPFNAWKAIYKEILIRIYTISRMRSRDKKKASMHTKTGNSSEIRSGVDYVMSVLPDKFKRLEPLLGYLTIIPDQPEALAQLRMNTQEMIHSAMELLFEIIQQYVVHTRNLCFLVMEDVHSFDLASQMLLKHLWASGKGIVVLFSAEHVKKAVKFNPKERDKSISLSINIPNSDSGGGTPVHSPTAMAYPGYRKSSLSTAYRGGEDSPAELHPHDFAASLKGDERYLNIDLDLFSEQLTATVVKSTLNSLGVVSTDSVILNKIYRESGGNPMYASELAKSVAKRHSQLIDPSMISVKPRNCHRVEEIICHRFDQLSNSGQMLLKVAAAICCFGASFDCKMLSFVMQDPERDGNHADLRAQLVDDLLDIVNSESFLVAHWVDPLTGGRGEVHEEDISEKEIADNLLSFEFGISMEKTTIYELLLSDQKQAIHERIAEYYQHRRQQDPSFKPCYYEESLHWQKASNWRYAMACSYQAHLVEDNWHRANEHINTAFKMYRSMREEQLVNHVPRTPQVTDIMITPGQVEWSAASMKLLHERALSNSNDLHKARDCTNLTLDQVSQMFNCDSELLKISLKVKMLMARKCLAKADRLQESQVYLEEALQILLLTKNRFLLSHARVTQLMYFLLRHLEVDEGRTPKNADRDEHYFSVGEEYEMLYQQLLSVYIENYLQMTTEPELSDGLEKVQFASDLLRDMSEMGGVLMHEIQSIALDLMLDCKIGNLRQACSLGQILLDLYVVEDHSSGLIAFYGRDIVPTALGMISQYMLLSSDWAVAIRFTQFAVKALEKMSHVETLSAAVTYLTNNLVFLRRIDDAVKLFSHYLTCLTMSSGERAITDGIYMEWLRRLTRYDAFQKTGDVSVFNSNVPLVDNMIEQCAAAISMESTANDEALFDAISVQGRGIDAVLAEVCALKIIVLWNANNDAAATAALMAVEGSENSKMEALRVYCKALSVYVRDTLTMTSGRPHELMFSKTNTVLTVLHLLQHISSPPSPGSNRSLLATKSLKSPQTMTTTLTLEDESWERQQRVNEVRDIITQHLINQLRDDCHPQYSVFTLLAASLLCKLKCKLGWDETDEESAFGFDTHPHSPSQIKDKLESSLGFDLNDEDTMTSATISNTIANGGSSIGFGGVGSANSTPFKIVSMHSGHPIVGGAGGGSVGFGGGGGSVNSSMKSFGPARIHDREARKHLQQFLINGSTAVKYSVLEKTLLAKLLSNL